jgi:phosphoribosylformylglycinamidine cyclo-ligase
MVGREKSSTEQQNRYKAAGVDRNRAADIIARIGDLAASTQGGSVVSGIGGFGGCFSLSEGTGKTILVASIDSVGTKTKLAALTGLWENIGYDIVAHCVNDVLVQGAEPLFFLDYVAMGRLEPEPVKKVAEGLARACREAGCALLGGETAELPDVYRPGDVELVGVIVGSVERDRMLDGSRLRVGDVLIGLPSSGLHTNGYTLARKAVVEPGDLDLGAVLPPMTVPLGEALMASHRLYLKDVRPLLRENLVGGMAHITGGGLVENVPRVLPKGLSARVRRGAWPVPPLFELLQERGGVSEEEMFRVFNMGIGWVLMVSRESMGRTLELLGQEGQDYWIIGDLVPGDRSVILGED